MVAYVDLLKLLPLIQFLHIELSLVHLLPKVGLAES